MNEKGFATIFGLCLILVIALVVKGIQEAEGNHSYEMTDFQVEMDLQNAADSGIYKAVEFVHANPDVVPFRESSSGSRKDAQYQFDPITIESSSGSIKVDVWAERIIIEPYRVDYENKKNKKTVANPLKNEDKERIYWRGYTFFSKAEIDSERIGGKLYRRSFAYIVDKIVTKKSLAPLEFEDADEDLKKKIHFMDIVSEDYYYKE